MSLLQLADELNLASKRTASTHGGEYHSSCPSCGGKDRFIIWEQQGRYFCRQCQKTGDAIQFCRDFMGMDYRSACAKLQLQLKETFSQKFFEKQRFKPVSADFPSLIWRENAGHFVRSCSAALEKDFIVQERLITERDLSKTTIQQFCIGWNSITSFVSLPHWGLPSSLNAQGQGKKLWLPRGIVIPTISSNEVIKIKIRRSDWKEEDKHPKYVEISGSMKSPSLYGNAGTKVIVILEAEFDAILVQQFASDLCCCMAIGGAGKRPDSHADQLLRNASIVLFALDFDEAGKKAYLFWRSTYPNLRAWPIPKGKSPGDAIKMGIDLRKWILNGLSQFN